MTKKRQSKRNALFMSLISLLLCISMLIGSTFAWFTDEATTGVNKIVSGNLDIELEYSYDMQNWEEAEDTDNIFPADDLWEPGFTRVVYFKVLNKGNLDVKYSIGTNLVGKVLGTNKEGKDIDLTDYIKFGIVEGLADGFKYENRKAAVDAVTTPMNFTSMYTAQNNLEAGEKAEDVFAMVVWMPEEVGNEANHNGLSVPSIEFGVKVFATQLNSEVDSFGPDYDEKAPLPVNPKEIEGEFEVTGESAPYKYAGEDVQIESPEKGTFVFSTLNKTASSVTYNIDFKNSAGEEQHELLGAAKIKVNVGVGLEDVKVTHDGNELFDAVTSADALADKKSFYDSSTGVLEIWSSEFSEYEVGFKEITFEASIGAVAYTTLEEAFEAVKNGETIKLQQDVIVTAEDVAGGTENKGTPVFVSTKDNVTLNLNGKTIKTDLAGKSVTGVPQLIKVTGGSLTIKGGTIDAEAGKNAAYGIVLDGGNVTIENGTYTGAPSAVQVTKGELTIKGGEFKLAKTVSSAAPDMVNYLINCIDANYKNKTANIVVTGGSFLNYNPAKGYNENPAANFLSEGYAVLENDGSYEVVKGRNIYNLDDLKTFKDEVDKGNNFAGETIVLSADIDFGGAEWSSIGSDEKRFAGTFDGQNHTISNFVLKGQVHSEGLFHTISAGGSIKNTKLDNVSAELTGQHTIGFLVATLLGDAENCSVKNATITTEGHLLSTGGMFGNVKENANINNCSVDGVTINMTSTTTAGCDCLGGFAGSVQGDAITITNCTANNVTITVGYRAKKMGGFAGVTKYATLTNCTISNVNITVDDYYQYNGGFVGTGDWYSTFINCDVNNVTATVTRNTVSGAFGGFAGRNLGGPNMYDGCDVEGANITVDDNSSTWGVGGFVGEANGTSTIKNSSAAGTIEATDAAIAKGYIKDFVGNYTPTLENNTVNVNVTVK